MTPEQEYEQAVIATMAHMTDADIQYWIDRLTAERSEPLYALKVSSYRFRQTATELYRYQAELLRRTLANLEAEHDEGRIGDTPIMMAAE